MENIILARSPQLEIIYFNQFYLVIINYIIRLDLQMNLRRNDRTKLNIKEVPL